MFTNTVLKSCFKINLLLTPIIRNQSNLSKLRKATGYPLASCRNALAQCNDNIELAQKWLDEQAQKEGWSKAEKLKDRTTSQGLLGFIKNNKSSVLVELNCETDFVAKNEKFHEVLKTITNSVMENLKTDQNKAVFLKNELVDVKSVNGRTIGDELALGIANLGENMSLRRAILFNVNEDEHLAWYVHGSENDFGECKLGKYVALTRFKMPKQDDGHKAFDIGRQVAQHIVGMKPTSMGTVPNQNEGETVKIDDNETRLLQQEFLMMPGLRVYDFLKQNNVELIDYLRVQCGETLENQTS